MDDKLYLKVESLIIFRVFLNDSTISKFVKVLKNSGEDKESMICDFCDFSSSLLSRATNLGELVRELLCRDDNIYATNLCNNKNCDNLEEQLTFELEVLDQMCAYDFSREKIIIGDTYFVNFKPEETNFGNFYRDRMANISTCGYGIWAKYHMFTLNDDGTLEAVQNPDPQALCDLYEYERERGQIVSNTKALLSGKPFNNVLLYGDAGTGKSSTVKAIANEYKNDGLRLIEIKKKQLYLIPSLIDQLTSNPLKFVLFIDDLTFASDDRDFTVLKAILEGGVSVAGKNIAIYVTSNHRHLVKESMADRQGDAVSVQDKMQEMVSLSARFGLTVTYQRPDSFVYRNITRALAKEYGVTLDDDTLITRAEAFAIRHGGRNPRTAKQFIIDLASN